MSRYIDVDLFKKNNERLLDCDFPYLCEDTLEEIIDSEPTADVRENVKGEWVELRNGVKRCSVCKFTSNHLMTDNFCPNCGADMRGEV